MARAKMSPLELSLGIILIISVPLSLAKRTRLKLRTSRPPRDTLALIVADRFVWARLGIQIKD